MFNKEKPPIIAEWVSSSLSTGSNYPHRDNSFTVGEVGSEIFNIDKDNEVYFSDNIMDKLLAKMMVHTQKVILPCRYCGSHNAFSNPTCVKCGAPMGGISYA